MMKQFRGIFYSGLLGGYAGAHAGACYGAVVILIGISREPPLWPLTVVIGLTLGAALGAFAGYIAGLVANLSGWGIACACAGLLVNGLAARAFELFVPWLSQFSWLAALFGAVGGVVIGQEVAGRHTRIRNDGLRRWIATVQDSDLQDWSPTLRLLVAMVLAVPPVLLLFLAGR